MKTRIVLLGMYLKQLSEDNPAVKTSVGATMDQLNKDLDELMKVAQEAQMEGKN